MKNYFKTLFSLLIILSLSATLLCCANSSDNNNDRTSGSENEVSEPQTTATAPEVTTATAAPVVTEIPGGDLPVLGGVMGKAEHTDYKEGEEVALSVNLLLPYAEIPDNEAVQQKVTQKLEAINDEIRSSVENISRNYINDLKNGVTHISTPSLSVSFTLCYFTEKAMSIAISMTETNSFSDTFRSCRYYNFELDSYGADITFDTLFSDRLNDNRDKITELITEKADGCGGLYPEYRTIIAENASECFYISGESVYFRFDPYVLAPGSRGYITFELKFCDISPYLSEYGRDLLDLK